MKGKFMPTMQEEYEALSELLEMAETRAATEVDTWIPEKPGDKISGVVEELGTITTKFGVYATTTITPFRDGKLAVGTLVRVAWMGAVLVASFHRMRPIPGEIVAFHYQKDVTPASGMNDYPLIVAVVIDPRTGRSKVPVNMDVKVPTEADIENTDPNTGEIAPGRTPEFTPYDPLAPVPGEEPL